MTQTRIYLPLSAADLASLAAGDEVAGRTAYAVTGALRSTMPTADEEELEYAALQDAVESSATVARGGGGSPARRLVAAADVDPGVVDEVSGPEPDVESAVTLTRGLALRRIVSFHLDEKPDWAQVDDLLWYDVTEVDEVVRLTR